jgi:LmbE family N-acetylglucosaminyl deacetylase
LLPLSWNQAGRAPTILCIGAHCDDIEIGCGATVALWAAQYPQARIVWAVFSGSPQRVAETRAAARALLGADRDVEMRILDFRDSYFPTQLAAIKEAFGQLAAVGPDVVLTHYEHDRHQDHRVLAELTWNTFRDHLILAYEIPKYDGDLGRPNVFVPLPAPLVERKVNALLMSFASQRNRDWFTADTFTSLLRLRGLECRAASGFAEGFHARKIVLGVPDGSNVTKPQGRTDG